MSRDLCYYDGTSEVVEVVGPSNDPTRIYVRRAGVVVLTDRSRLSRHKPS